MIKKTIKLHGVVNNTSACFLRSSSSEEHLKLFKKKKKSVPAPPAPGKYDVQRSLEFVTKGSRKQSLGRTKRFTVVGLGATNTVTPAPCFDPSNLDLDSTHRVFPRNSFPK